MKIYEKKPAAFPPCFADAFFLCALVAAFPLLSACRGEPLPEEKWEMRSPGVMADVDLQEFLSSTEHAFCARGTAKGEAPDKAAELAKEAAYDALVREVRRHTGSEIVSDSSVSAPAREARLVPREKIVFEVGTPRVNLNTGIWTAVVGCSISRDEVRSLAISAPPSAYDLFSVDFDVTTVPAEIKGVEEKYESDYKCSPGGISVRPTACDAWLSVFWISEDGSADIVYPKNGGSALKLKKGETFTNPQAWRFSIHDSADVEHARLVFLLTTAPFEFPARAKNFKDRVPLSAADVTKKILDVPASARAIYIRSFSIVRGGEKKQDSSEL